MANWTWTNLINGQPSDVTPINSMGQQVQALVNPQRSSVASTSNSAAIGATDTELMRIPAFTFRDGRAYRLVVLGGILGSANEGNFSVYKNTAVSGNRMTEFYRTPATTSVRNCDGTRYMKNTSGADVTCDVLLTLSTSSGTVNTFATAQTPFAFIIEECGNAADYSFAVQA